MQTDLFGFAPVEGRAVVAGFDAARPPTRGLAAWRQLHLATPGSR
jgi:hypothetical protein